MAEKQVDLSGRKVFIGIPAYDGKLNIKTAYALAKLMPVALQHGVSFHLSHMSGCSIITMARNALVSEFLKTDAEELLFIDADVVVEPDDVMRLLAPIRWRRWCRWWRRVCRGASGHHEERQRYRQHAAGLHSS